MAASTASRTNRLLAGCVALVLVGSGIAAWTQRARTESTGSTSGDSSPITAPSDTTGRRPAETGYSWFNHGFAVEQFDIDMPALSCKELAATLTPDLCTVARTSNGPFMLVGTEGFWDVTEADANGTTWVPFDLTAYVLRSDMEGTRAVSVLDGFTSVAVPNSSIALDLYVATVNGDDVIVLHRHLAEPDDDAFSFGESVQIIAMSPTGAPTIVATYEGFRMSVASTGTSIELSSLRYRTAETNPAQPFFTRISVLPEARYSSTSRWNETVTSSKAEVPNGQSMTLEGRYLFPASSAETADF